MQPGEYPRIVFRQCPNHAHTEIWQQRPVRAPPLIPGKRTGKLAYYNNSKTMANSNVLQARAPGCCQSLRPQTPAVRLPDFASPRASETQVILRDHGYERVENKEDDWSIFWCAGQMEPSVLASFNAYQRINKFPKATALTLKQNLWQCVKAMITKHGEECFPFMPRTFVLPRELKPFEAHLRARLIEPGGADDVWIFKPAAVRDHRTPSHAPPCYHTRHRTAPHAPPRASARHSTPR